jgi:polygalacturonase
MGHDNVPVEERVFGTPKAGMRPTFLEFVNCHVVTIENVTLMNSPMWTVHPLYSSNVTINNIKIKTDPGKNTDGIAIDSTSDVLIENSQLSTGDDSIVLKSGRDNDGLRVNIPTQNVVVRNCHISEAHAGIAIGSEVSGGIINVDIENSMIDNSQYGIRLKSAPGRGGFIKNIWVNNTNINNASISAIQIDNLYQDSFAPDNQKTTKISDIHINKVIAKKAKESIDIRGTQDNFIENVTLDNISIGSNNGPLITYTKNLIMDKIKINSNRSPLFTLDNSMDTKINNYDCSGIAKNCFLIGGEKSSNIYIGNNGSKISPEKINFQGINSSVLSE